MPNSVTKPLTPPPTQGSTIKRENSLTTPQAPVEPPQLPVKQPNGPSGIVNSEGSRTHSPTLQHSQPQTNLKVETRDEPHTPQTPQNHQLPMGMASHQTPDINTPQGPKTKGALKGWSNLRLGDTPTNPALGALGGQPPSHPKSRPVDTSSTFAAYQKAAKEKADRERSLREQQESSRRQKERSEKERVRLEQERRKEKEEEDALEQARRAAMLAQMAPQQVAAVPQIPAVAAVPTEADRARIDRERQRQREQERRRREAQQN